MDAIYFARLNDTIILRLVGAIRYSISPDFENFIKRLLENNDDSIKAIILDLSQTQLIDSTNLGLLAQIANWSLSHLSEKPVLYSTNPDITSLLLGVSFDLVFTIVDCLPKEQDDLVHTVVPLSSNPEKAELARTLVSAHKTLMALSEDNYQQFSDVIRLLQQDITKI